VQYEQALLDGKVSAGELEALVRRDARNESRSLRRAAAVTPADL
jgi:hypothetical protein